MKGSGLDVKKQKGGLERAGTSLIWDPHDETPDQRNIMHSLIHYRDKRSRVPLPDSIRNETQQDIVIQTLDQA